MQRSLIFIRSAIFSVAFYTWTVLCTLLMIPCHLAPYTWMLWWCRTWQNGTIFLLWLICGVRVEVRGLLHKPSGAALIAAKHQCSFDAFAPLALFELPCIVAKQELMRIPLFGSHAMHAGVFLTVDRGAHAKALRSLLSQGRNVLAAGRQLVIYPEGTRAALGAPPDYKQGVAALYTHLNVPCTPMATNAGAHWRAGSMLRVPGTIVFEYLPVIPAGLPRDEFMATLQERIETASNALLGESSPSAA